MLEDRHVAARQKSDSGLRPTKSPLVASVVGERDENETAGGEEDGGAERLEAAIWLHMGALGAKDSSSGASSASEVMISS